jgi:hypothetical protein
MGAAALGYVLDLATTGERLAGDEVIQRLASTVSEEPMEGSTLLGHWNLGMT